jgi:hypothetical protein
MAHRCHRWCLLRTHVLSRRTKAPFAQSSELSMTRTPAAQLSPPHRTDPPTHLHLMSELAAASTLTVANPLRPACTFGHSCLQLCPMCSVWTCCLLHVHVCCTVHARNDVGRIDAICARGTDVQSTQQPNTQRRYAGLKLMSYGWSRHGKAAVLRGPLVSGLVTQLATNTAWGNLDVLLIDMPPGTGDIHITVR